MSTRPNILIIMPDTHRADALGCVSPVTKTPHLDALAAAGTNFTHCCTVSPLCMPARASVVSGTYVHEHHMWANRGQLVENDETFFHHLQRAGYQTAHVGKSHYYNHGGVNMHDWEPWMRARGIEYVHETTGPWATVKTDSYLTEYLDAHGLLQTFRNDYRKRAKDMFRATWPSPVPAEHHPDSYVGAQAIEFLNKHTDDRPWCMFVGFGGPHDPWDAAGEYATLHDTSDMPTAIPAEPVPDTLSDRAKGHLLGHRVENPTAEEVAKLRVLYAGKVSLIDHWIGEIMRAVDARGERENTCVIFWSDHGDFTGDHARIHKVAFYEGALRVPLIVSWPGHLAEGVTSDALVENIDVFPTILDAAGCEPSERSSARSLVPLATGETTDGRDVVLSEVQDWVGRTMMVRTRTHKYAMDEFGEGYMLFDLASDPDEQVNLIGRDDTRNLERDMCDLLLREMAARQYTLRAGVAHLHDKGA